ncbi:hypothetical protein KUTeg_001476 [Tegillarca granosa]|uniref:Myosin light chain kinase, smooth muscle n=1 Tax=Tegillarca granosa TaxID=220873 RepID=A0ABQ9FRK0_TEGGR|nr:hypothetical protein KUTeg_001476 [Tegillarca granosa]
MENKGRYNILTGEDNMLEIKKVTIEDAGRYVCVLSNNAGSISSNVDLVVKKLSSQKEERPAVCGSGISQEIEKQPDRQRDADKSKVLDIDVTCRVKLDKTKTLASDSRIPSVSVNITSPDGRRRKQELVDKKKLETKLENSTLVMKSSSSVVPAPKSIQETSQPSLKSESASTKCLNPVEIGIKKKPFLTETSIDKESVFHKKSSVLTDLRTVPPAKDNQIDVKKSEINTKSTGSIEPQDFRQVVLKKKTVTVNDRTVLANITTKTDKPPKVDYRSVLSSSTKSPLGGQNFEKKTTVQQDFRNVLKKTDTGTKPQVASSVSENKSKFGSSSSNIQGNISDSLTTKNRTNKSDSGILEDSTKSREQKVSTVTKLYESKDQNAKAEKPFNNSVQSATTKGGKLLNTVETANTVQSAKVEKPLNSVQTIKADKPFDVVQTSKGDKPLNLVQSTKVDKSLNSLQTLKGDKSLHSKQEKPINSVQITKNDKLLDNTQTPKPVLSKSNQQDFRSVLSHRTNKDSSINTEREKSPLISKQHDFRSVLKHHVDVDSRQAPKIISHLCDISVQEGKYVTMECKVNGSPIPEITWSVNGKEIKPSKFFRMTYEDSLARLTISGAYPEDDGKYTCVASNSLGRVQSSCVLHVQEFNTSTEHTDEDIPSDTPSNQISEHTDEDIPLDKLSNKISDSITNEIPQKSNIETTNEKSEKHNVISIQSIPEKSISELSESGVDTMKDDISVESDKNEADIKDVIQESPISTVSQSEDEGFDDYPPDTSSSGQAPQIHDISPARLKIKQGSDTKIQVSYTSENTTAVVKWFRDTTQINDNEKYLIRTTEHFTSLQILNIQRDDSGKYKVVIENTGGSNSAVSNITVEDVPDSPMDKPYASEVNLTSVILTWSTPAQDGGCRVTSYKVEMCKAEDNIWETVSPNCHSTSYQVENLIPNTPYFFRVSARNKHGYSEPSQTSDVVVPKERRLSHRLSFDSDEEDIPFSPRNVIMKHDITFESAYDLKDHMGKGKFGNVYRCVEKISGKTLAAKVIKCRAKEKQKVQRELEIMNKLTHPKLLMLWDAFETARSITLVMECIEGGELFERVVDEDFDLTERDTVYFMRQICDGVSYMHDQGIIHLDLKPENILCVHKDSNLIKIIDFGLARFHHDGESARVMYGTPEFIAPEVVNYEEIGFPTDIWSLGVICYVLLSGLSPFMGDNDAETLSNVTMGEFDFDDEAFDEISDNAKDFISNALQKNMKKRFTIKQCQEHQWLARAERQSGKKLRQSLRNLKHFMARRRWQMGNAIRALGRMSSLPMQLQNKSKSSGNSLLSDSDTASQSDVSTTPSSTSSVSRLNEDSVSQRQSDNTKTKDDKEIHDDVFYEPVQKANSLTSQQNDNGKDHESYKITNNDLTSMRTKNSPSFLKEMVDCKAFTGDVVRFDVTVSGDPQPDVCWYLEGAKINSDSRHTTTNENGECSLIIKQVTVNDEGEYSCRAKNTQGEIKCCAELIIYRTGAV